MESRRISSPEELVNIYGRDGAVMNDLIKKGVSDFLGTSRELTEVWADTFDNKKLCLQAVSIALIGTIYQHILILKEIGEETGNSSDIEAQLQTIKNSLNEIIKDL